MHLEPTYQNIDGSRSLEVLVCRKFSRPRNAPVYDPFGQHWWPDRHVNRVCLTGNIGSLEVILQFTHEVPE